jgi:DNA topoisomerase-1
MCPECGKELVVRQSRRGPFVGCSGYPDCRFIEKSESAAGDAGGGDEQKEGGVCPKCNEGELVKRRGRFGEFLGCSRYPDCDYIKRSANARPAPVPTGRNCPECGKPLVTRQSKRGPFVGCSGYPKCRFIERAEGAAAGTDGKAVRKVDGKAVRKVGGKAVRKGGGKAGAPAPEPEPVVAAAAPVTDESS